MTLYATVTSERATKGQGGNDYLEIVITGAHETELITLKIHPNGSKYELRGWTHDNHFMQYMIEENMTKGEKQKGVKCRAVNCPNVASDNPLNKGYCADHF
jgi:hypothetical protein